MFALERTCDHQLARHPPDGEGKAIFAVTHIMVIIVWQILATDATTY